MSETKCSEYSAVSIGTGRGHATTARASVPEPWCASPSWLRFRAPARSYGGSESSRRVSNLRIPETIVRVRNVCAIAHMNCVRSTPPIVHERNEVQRILPPSPYEGQGYARGSMRASMPGSPRCCDILSPQSHPCPSYGGSESSRRVAAFGCHKLPFGFVTCAR
jgi:hypothetical protein